MSKINKINKLSNLFDAYSNLLTDNQKDIFIMYYLEDQSLAEIADVLSVSRPSVSDSLKKTEEKLLKYESKLKLVARNSKIEDIIESIDDEKIKEAIKNNL